MIGNRRAKLILNPFRKPATVAFKPVNENTLLFIIVVIASMLVVNPAGNAIIAISEKNKLTN
jgi:hypothetical protein